MKNVLEYLETSCTRDGGHVAFSDEKDDVTYAQTLEMSRRIGSYLASSVDGHGAPIAVILDKTVYAPLAFFGVAYSGNVYVVIDDHMPAARIEAIFGKLQPAAILTDHAHDDLIASLTQDPNHPRPTLFMEDALDFAEDDGGLKRIRDAQTDSDPLYILFTSGSTGTPKGTVVSHGNVIAYISWVTGAFPFGPDTVFGSQTPFYFSMSVLDIYTTIASGAHLQIIPRTMFSFPVQLVAFLTERHVNTLYWVPSALMLISNWDVFKYVPAPPLKLILFAGEVMPTRQLNYWMDHLPYAHFANLFGPTETTDICTFWRADRRLPDDEPVPMGLACDNCEALVIDADGHEVEDDGEGELYVRGAIVAQGYYNDPQKTADAFVQNPLNHAYPETVYRTGDIVRRNAEGELVYVCRRDFQIKHMGYRIELGEIETAANALPLISASACLYHAPSDAIVLVYEPTPQKAAGDKPEVLAGLQKKLPTYMLPARIVRLAQLPHNANGKIDRKALERQLADGSLKDDPVR